MTRGTQAQRWRNQAINELRVNCASDDVFMPDSSHVEWYRRVNWVERHRGLLRWTSLPYTAHDAWMELQELTGRYRPIPFDTVGPRLLEYGQKLKTPPSFQRNVDAIATLARKRNDPLLLMTYAWYLPEGYTHKRFEKRIAGYTGHAVSVEIPGPGGAHARAARVLERHRPAHQPRHGRVRGWHRPPAGGEGRLPGGRPPGQLNGPRPSRVPACRGSRPEAHWAFRWVSREEGRAGWGVDAVGMVMAEGRACAG